MARINLEEFDNGDDSAPASNTLVEVGPGRKSLLAVGHEYFVINDKPVVSIRFVCVEDHEGGSDEGNILTDTFFLNDKAVWRVARYALATGWREAFDPEIEDELVQVMMAGPVCATITLEKNGEYTNRRVKRYDRCSTKVTKEKKTLVENAESHWAGYLAWRQKNPRPGAARAQGGSSQKSYDDIPF